MTLKADIIGLGAHARSDHLLGIAAAASTEMVAACDTDAALVQQIQYEFPVKGYPDYREMFTSEDLDLAVVCVPHPTEVSGHERAT